MTFWKGRIFKYVIRHMIRVAAIAKRNATRKLGQQVQMGYKKALKYTEKCKVSKWSFACNRQSLGLLFHLVWPGFPFLHHALEENVSATFTKYNRYTLVV